jgi:FkbM family methyltransferase
VLATLQDRLNKPAYLYRPGQLVRRVLVRGKKSPVVKLPWGSRLAVTATESIGSGIARTGVHELVVTEAVYRLLGPGDFAVDVGANVGYYTSLMAFRVGTGGSVLALEPHPALVERLRDNVSRWPTCDRVTVDSRASSDAAGTAHLEIPAGFTTNMGIAGLRPPSAQSLEVQTVPLDALLPDRRVALLKLDVEGHELGALAGMKGALQARTVQHIVFEEQRPFPTPVSELLERRGFTIFGLHERFRGVEPVDPSDQSAHARWDAQTYLATLTPDLVRARLRPNGWRCLRPRFVGG